LLPLLTATAPMLRAAPISGFGSYRPAPLFSESVSSSMCLPMRDGVRLAVRISRPARDHQPAAGRFPVIWQHALSITEGPDAAQEPVGAGLNNLPALTAYGYVIVQVARRGNGQSFGARRGYNDRTEADDAYEVTEWLAAQPWSTGSVGIYGCSNTGDAAMHALSSRPPHLRAVFAGCFSWNKFDAMRRGGIFAQWGTGPQRTLEQDMSVEPVASDTDKTLLRAAAQEHQNSTDLLAMWQQLPFRDSWSTLVSSRFWAESSISSYAPQLRQLAVPVYIMGGWHDELRDQGLIALLNLPGARVLIGPWRHCQNPGFELLQEIHRFFDTHLKGMALGLDTQPPVHYFTMDGDAGGTWKAAPRWPVPGMRLERWFVGTAAALQRRAPEHQFEGTFVVHTDVDCPGGGVGPFMQPCHTAGAGLSVRSAALAADLTLTGNPVVNLPIRADRADANLFAYLEDVAPEGRITVITEGRLKASLRAEATPPFAVPGTPWHRSYAQDASPLQSGAVAILHFDLLPTSYIVRAGHHLQLTLMGADYRERARDPGIKGTQITLSSTPASPGWIDLPLEPAAP
jgi:predicted acyl esterase